jgi:hypothetical protein
MSIFDKSTLDWNLFWIHIDTNLKAVTHMTLKCLVSSKDLFLLRLTFPDMVHRSSQP